VQGFKTSPRKGSSQDGSLLTLSSATVGGRSDVGEAVEKPDQPLLSSENIFPVASSLVDGRRVGDGVYEGRPLGDAHSAVGDGLKATVEIADWGAGRSKARLNNVVASCV